MASSAQHGRFGVVYPPRRHIPKSVSHTHQTCSFKAFDFHTFPVKPSCVTLLTSEMASDKSLTFDREGKLCKNTFDA
ncbi:hypothetical protein F2P81_014152 [Scophthalmus maximus]|uniref:Uncharacterized protein n=1 Tax=Scophthalmus maximus TaxID=52904 RepID=A0A6A4SG05_SCOMX|nr:hypothetical protein F2P81_014152 [Scophthalmus maximus]